MDGTLAGICPFLTSADELRNLEYIQRAWEANMSALDFLALMQEEQRKVKMAKSANQANLSPSMAKNGPLGEETSKGGSQEEMGSSENVKNIENLDNDIPPIKIPEKAPLSPPPPAPAGLSLYEDFIDGEGEMALANFARGEGGWNVLKHAKRRVLEIKKGDDDWGGGGRAYIETLCEALLEMGIFPREFPPNHALINDYTSEQGILPHTDGPMYYSTTATLSLESSTLFFFKKRLRTEEIGTVKDEIKLKVLLRPRSLVVFKGTWYGSFLHGIDEEQEEQCGEGVLGAAEGQRVERGQRISFTIRHKLMENHPIGKKGQGT